MMKYLLSLLLAALLLLTSCKPSEGTSASSEGPSSTPPVSGTASLSFRSFDGGGPEFTVTAEDPEMITWTSERKYDRSDHDEIDGAGYTVVFRFTGLKQGTTSVTVSTRSSIAENYDEIYDVQVEEDLTVKLDLRGRKDRSGEDEARNNGAVKPSAVLVMHTGDRSFYPQLEENSSVEALLEKLQKAPLTVRLTDYGNFEKVGPLPWSLPKNDRQITTAPGDIILYQGNQITVYYDENTWSFTKLGHIPNVTREELLEVLGEGSVEVMFYLEWSE